MSADIPMDGDVESESELLEGLQAQEDDGADSEGSSDYYVSESVHTPPPPLDDRVLLLLDASAPSTNYDGFKLCKDLWSSLPEDLLLRVFAWLPAVSICRMRCACKLWRARLSDENLLLQNASNFATSPAFVKYVEQLERRPEDPETLVDSKWSLLKLDFFPGYRFSSLASARGLLVLLLDAFQGIAAPAVLVVNPLTKTWIILPNPPNPTFQAAVSMVYEERSQAYVIVVVNHRIFNPLLETAVQNPDPDYDSGESDSETLHYVITADFFDSTENIWRTATQVFQARVEGGHIFCDGSIYWLATHHEPGTGLNVISYDFRLDTWLCFRLPKFTLLRIEAEGASSISCNLVGVQGRVLLAAEVVDGEDSHQTSISIWEYRDKAEWLHIHSISSDVYLTMLGNPAERGVLNFVGYGDVMWINLQGSPFSLAYDFHTRTLRKLPDCPFHVEDKAADMDPLARIYRMPFLYGFQPRLDPVERVFVSA